MALAHSVPRGVGVPIHRALDRQIAVRQLLGWLGLAGLTALWLRGSIMALRIHSLVVSYESGHGPALAQWEGRAARAPEFESFKMALEAIRPGTGSFVMLELFPVSLLVLFGLWVGCSRWALAHRPRAWRRTFVTAGVVMAAQAVLLYPAIDAYSRITN